MRHVCQGSLSAQPTGGEACTGVPGGECTREEGSDRQVQGGRGDVPGGDTPRTFYGLFMSAAHLGSQVFARQNVYLS